MWSFSIVFCVQKTTVRSITCSSSRTLAWPTIEHQLTLCFRRRIFRLLPSLKSGPLKIEVAGATDLIESNKRERNQVNVRRLPSPHKLVSRLKRVLADKTMELDFFEGALQKVEARRQQSGVSGAKASIPNPKSDAFARQL